jgi:hypothetical protein
VAVATADRACLAMSLMLEPDVERRGPGHGRGTRQAHEGHESARTSQGTGHLKIVHCFRFEVNNTYGDLGVPSPWRPPTRRSLTQRATLQRIVDELESA